MCGFVGFVDSTIDNSSEVIKDMMNVIIHRGPDSEGSYTDQKATLGFRRLSIIDMAEAASQPMFNEDRTIVLVFNGEIYNFQEIKEELLTKGHIFGSHTDSEVLIHGYEEYGVDLLQKLRGMFSFAIWDAKKELLFIARDFFGIKPLYYSQNTEDGSFIFGSEIKSFLKHPQFNKTLNKEALKPYLTFQYSAMDETFFKGVFKLKPAHYLIYQKGSITIERFWDPRYSPEENTIEHYVDELKKAMVESVAYHKISDVKVGAFLSGGIDSSYITALLKPNHTFTVGFADHEGEFNETNLAKELSDILGLHNFKRIISADDFFNSLSTIQYHMDEPHSNLSSVPLYFLAELARKHVTVILSGEGADELFGGYVWYEKSDKIKRYERVPFFIRRGVGNLAQKLPASTITTFLVRGGKKVEEKFIGQAKIFEEAEAVKILKAPYRKSPSVGEITGKIYDRVKDNDELSKMQYLDINLWLPGDILLKADKMSMAHSIELRVPFLDKEIMKLAGKLPTRFRVNAKHVKYALRLAALEVIPKQWANRKKVGFMVPFKHWIRQEKYYNLVKEMFQSDMAKEFFDQKEIALMLEEHFTGKRNRARGIYTIYTFLIWYKRFFVEC